MVVKEKQKRHWTLDFPPQAAFEQQKSPSVGSGRPQFNPNALVSGVSQIGATSARIDGDYRDGNCSGDRLRPIPVPSLFANVEMMSYTWGTCGSFFFADPNLL